MAKPIFCTESLVAWLKLQDPTKEYQYCEPSRCVIAQYLQACGVEEWESSLNTDELRKHDWLEIAGGQGFSGWTFGAALKRAEKQLATR